MSGKTGICINFGNCSKAKEREIQTVDETNFICQECGQPLITRSNNNMPKIDIKKILVITSIIVAIIGLGIFLYLMFNHTTQGKDINKESEIPKIVVESEKETTNTEKEDLIENVNAKNIAFTDIENSLQIYKDEERLINVNFTPNNANETIYWYSQNTSIVKVTNEGLIKGVASGTTIIQATTSRSNLSAKIKITVKERPNSKNGVDLGYAIWTGAVDNNNLPNDTNGRMYFKRRHRISDKDESVRYAEKGESIIGEYVHGKLVQGKWYKKDNNIEIIMIGM